MSFLGSLGRMTQINVLSEKPIPILCICFFTESLYTTILLNVIDRDFIVPPLILSCGLGLGMGCIGVGLRGSLNVSNRPSYCATEIQLSTMQNTACTYILDICILNNEKK